MKKILGLLGTITIAGSGITGIVGNAPASAKNEINYLETNNSKNLNRVKRGPNDNDGNDLAASTENMYFHFKPNLWEEIIIAKYESGNNFENFKEKFKDILKDYYNKNDIGEWDIRVTYYYVGKFAEGLWNNWSTVISEWRGSSKRERIRIIINWNGEFNRVNIITVDKNFYENKYLNKQIINEVLLNINLSEIYESKTTNILDAIKTKNPNIDISHLSVSDITNTSATITVISSGKYKELTWVYVYFEKPNLVNDFKTCLNLVDNINDETILAAAKQANPDLDITQIYVKEKVPNGKLTVAVKADSNKYNIDSSVSCNNFKVRQNLNEIIANTNLNIINNNNNSILNELNYLNLNLDISQLEVVEKTNISVIIQARKDSDKYFGEKKIWYTINNQENKIINLNELIKKGIFLSYRDKNQEITIKEIKNINIDNLNFRNVEITRNEDSKLLHSVNFKEPSCFKKRDRINTSSIKKTFKIPKCDYNSKSKLVFQITTGLNKTKQENELNGWNINPDDEMQLHDFLNLNNKQSEIINVLSNEFDLSNINKQEQEMILYSFSDVEDEIDLAPQERVIFQYSVREINLETILNLKQKISGTITAKIIDDNNEEQTMILSIKEAMQILQEHSLLPDEITINEDNSITFNGNAKISLTQEAEPKLIINTSIV